MPTPDFDFKTGQFPIASIVDAAQRKAQIEQQAREYGQQQLQKGFETIGQAGQALIDSKKRMAQALTLGQQFGMTPQETAGLDPAQVIQAAGIKKSNIDMNMLLNLLHPNSGVGRAVGASAGGTPAPSGNGAILASDSTTTPVPAPAPIPAAQGAVPIAAPPIIPTVNKATADMAMKMAAANRPENVISQQAALAAGQVPKGTRIINSASELADEKNQDKLENQAINRVVGIRGDASLARTENQRDASTQAFNTIEQIKNENRMPSQLEYYDILGQMWKARTGSSPTDQAIRDLDARTFKGDLGKAAQYFSGKPAGRTTAEVLQNIQDFAEQSGKQADKLHAGYMQTHLIKPKGLSNDRWKTINDSARGLSFDDATAHNRKATSQEQDAAALTFAGDKERRYQEWKSKQGI